MESLTGKMGSLLQEMETIPAKEVPLALILLIVAAVAYRFFQNKEPDISHIPILRKELGGFDTLKSEFSKKGKDMLMEGYAKVRISWHRHMLELLLKDHCTVQEEGLSSHDWRW